MIEFNQVKEIIPEKGSLVMVMSRSNGDILITLAQKFAEGNGVPPINLKGTPEELNEVFRTDIKEIAELQEKVAKMPKVTAKTTVTVKKKELTKKLSENIKTDEDFRAMGKTPEAAKEEATEELF